MIICILDTIYSKYTHLPIANYFNYLRKKKRINYVISAMLKCVFGLWYHIRYLRKIVS